MKIAPAPNMQAADAGARVPERRGIPAAVILYRDGVPLQQLALTRNRTTVGRRTYNDIIIDAAEVSAEHAVIVATPEGHVYEDLDSTNGSRVNGQPVRRHLLRAGDVIAFGAHTLAFVPAAAGAGQALPAVAPEALRQPPQPVPGVPRADRAVGIVRILSGFAAGRQVALTRTMTTIGYPDRQVAVFVAAEDGYTLMQVEGPPPLINGTAMRDSRCPLNDGDVIGMDGSEAIFFLDWWHRVRRP